MAHGGQLTINPQTGLPEAGFLSSILPMVAGMAINAYAPGLGTAMTGALVGGASYLMNPKAGLMGGLMAGMGAYGGATMGEALAAQGMQASAGIPEAAKGLGALTAESTAEQVTAARLAAEESAKKFAANQVAYQGGDLMNNLGTMGQGVKSTFTPGGFSSLSQNMGGPFGMAKTALAAAAPAMSMQPKDTSVAPVADKDMGQRYSYSPGVAQPLPAPDVRTYEDMLTKQGNFGRQQNYYPNQGYTPISNDEAKSMYGFAGGGPVEQMSNNNAIGANTGFPQAYLHNNAYATPYQTPISQNVLTGAGDVSVDPYTGEQRMASGGKAANKPENRDVDIYNDTNGPGSADGPSSSSTSSNGSPTGSTIGDAGYAISNQSFSPLAAAIAQAAMDAMSSTSNVSVNATNGMDVQSDQATATGASSAAGVDGPAGASSNGMGSDTAGDSSGPGEARGGLSPRFKYHMATGGISDAGYNLGGYSDGGRLLRGPGDGVSDSIPAVIGKKQPARLADGEFVVPARIVSELGNGSTEAGARRLYAMMDRVQAARGKTVGKGRVARNTRADKYLPA
jgi:hypothetical protein